MLFRSQLGISEGTVTRRRQRLAARLAAGARNGDGLAPALGDGLAALATTHASVVREARGMGLLRAIDLKPGGVEPAALVTAARDAGLLLVRGGERALRVLPPLTVTDAEIHEGLDRLDTALRACASKGGEQK